MANNFLSCNCQSINKTFMRCRLLGQYLQCTIFLAILLFSTCHVYFEVPFNLYQYAMTAILVDSTAELRVYHREEIISRAVRETKNNDDDNDDDDDDDDHHHHHKYYDVKASDRLVAVDQHVISLDSFETVAEKPSGSIHVLPIFEEWDALQFDDDMDVRLLSGFVKIHILNPMYVEFEPMDSIRSSFVHNRHVATPYANVYHENPHDSLQFRVPFKDLIQRRSTVRGVFADETLQLRLASIERSSSITTNNNSKEYDNIVNESHPLMILDIAPSDRLVSVDGHAIQLRNIENDLLDDLPGTTVVVPLVDSTESNILSGFLHLEILSPSVLTFEPTILSRIDELQRAIATDDAKATDVKECDMSVMMEIEFSQHLDSLAVTPQCSKNACDGDGKLRNEGRHQGDAPSSQFEREAADSMRTLKHTDKTIESVLRTIPPRSNHSSNETGSSEAFSVATASESTETQTSAKPDDRRGTHVMQSHECRHQDLSSSVVDLSNAWTCDGIDTPIGRGHDKTSDMTQEQQQLRPSPPLPPPPPSSSSPPPPTTTTTIQVSATKESMKSALSEATAVLLGHTNPIVETTPILVHPENSQSTIMIDSTSVRSADVIDNNKDNHHDDKSHERFPVPSNVERTPASIAMQGKENATTAAPGVAVEPPRPSYEQLRRDGNGFTYDAVFETETRLGINWNLNEQRKTIVDSVEAHSPAAQLNLILPFDHLVLINGLNVSQLGPYDVVPHYRAASWPRTLTFVVPPKDTIPEPKTVSTVPSDASTTTNRTNASTAVDGASSSGPGLHPYTVTPLREIPSVRRHGHRAFWYELVFHTTNTPLGLYWDLHNTSATIVHTIEPESAAAAFHVIMPGDQLVAINHVNVSTKGPRETLTVFRASKSPRTLVFYCREHARQPQEQQDGTRLRPSTTETTVSSSSEETLDSEALARQRVWGLVPLDHVTVCRTFQNASATCAFEMVLKHRGPIGIIWDRSSSRATIVKHVEPHSVAAAFPIIEGDHLIAINDVNVSAMGILTCVHRRDIYR
jgi:hypothetical protein